MMSTYPWESPELVATEDAELIAIHDAAREAWLDDYLSELFEEPVKEPAYVPFQLDASEYADCAGTLADEIGYAESVTQYLF